MRNNCSNILRAVRKIDPHCCAAADDNSPSFQQGLRVTWTMYPEKSAADAHGVDTIWVPWKVEGVRGSRRICERPRIGP